MLAVIKMDRHYSNLVHAFGARQAWSGQSSHHFTVVTRALEILAGLYLRQARSRQYLHVMYSCNIVVSSCLSCAAIFMLIQWNRPIGHLPYSTVSCRIS